ncbi:MAG: SecC motif-containing protein [Gammaproteobacteria bacterium]|nr:MAG: SecC motif-containing protein [Gammaproteobacteria bacterium]
MQCPCGSKLTFEQCCQTIINNKTAKTAEQLMRSRYSAYATNNAQYLYDSYASISQQEQSVSEIKSWAKQCQWLELSIIKSSDYDDYSTVEFSTNYLQKDKLYQLHELSKFIQEPEPEQNQEQTLEHLQWRYLDGKIIANKVIRKIKANELCPCNSGKKFKKCCKKIK